MTTINSNHEAFYSFNCPKLGYSILLLPHSEKDRAKLTREAKKKAFRCETSPPKSNLLLTSSFHFCFRTRGSPRRNVVLCAAGQKREYSQFGKQLLMNKKRTD